MKLKLIYSMNILLQFLKKNIILLQNLKLDLRVQMISVLNTIVCNYEDKEKGLDKLNKFKAPGPDNLVPLVLKYVKNSIIENLIKIFNSMKNCYVPLDWKLANVTLIHKKGDKSQAENYKPISLTSVVGKLLETIVTNHISNHLESNNLLKDNQHGFRRHRSCLINLLEFFHEVYLEYDNNNAHDVIYLDLRKAIDTVPHEKLIRQMKRN